MRWLCTIIGIVAGLSLIPVASAAPAGIPGLPPGIPHVPTLPKPDAKAVFDVIVEGEAKDTNHSQLSGQDAECLVQEDGTVIEKDTYLRGRGVQIEFARYGKTIIVKRNRGGQLGDLSLAVKVTVLRTATGGATYSPAFAGAQCSVPPTDLSQNKDCGKSIDFGKSAMVFGYQDNKINLEVSRSTKLGGNFTIDTCGEDKTTGVSDELYWAWPHPIELKVGGFVARSEIFNRRIHVITRTLLASDGQFLPKHPEHLTFGKLTGTVTDTGQNKATIRLIRVG
jgi:hypothetical protein